MRILITGGSGFIGTNLVDFYRRSGDEVLSLDAVPPRDPSHAPVWVKADLLDAAELARVVAGFAPQRVYHFGARTDLAGATIEDYAANTDGVRHVIAALSQAPSVERVIFASSRLVCRIGYQPRTEDDYCATTVYGWSKAEGEKIVRASSPYPFEWIMVRPTSIWGPWFDVPYKDFFVAIRRGLYVHPRGQTIYKSFGFVGNTVHELHALMTTGDESLLGRTVYLADYPPLDVRQFAEAVRCEIGARPIRDVPFGVLSACAALGDVLKRIGWQSVPLTTFRLNNLVTQMVHDLAPLERVVGALPYSMEAGVEQTVQWLRARGEA